MWRCARDQKLRGVERRSGLGGGERIARWYRSKEPTADQEYSIQNHREEIPGFKGERERGRARKRQGNEGEEGGKIRNRDPKTNQKRYSQLTLEKSEKERGRGREREAEEPGINSSRGGGRRWR